MKSPIMHWIHSPEFASYVVIRDLRYMPGALNDLKETFMLEKRW